jgi:hypothetical protein
MALDDSEPGEARLIRYDVQAVVKDSRVLVTSPSGAIPSAGRKVVAVACTLPAAFILTTRLLVSGGPHTPGWQLLFGSAVTVQAALLFFQKPLERLVERAAVRWALRAGRASGRLSFEGIVVADSTFDSGLSGRAAVLVRTRRVEPAPKLVSDSLMAVDFTIEADDGVRYAVAPSEHLYFDEPPPEPDGVQDPATESLLCPGDRVRVWGTAVSEPSVLGERADPRSPPMRLALVGSESSPLVIRLVKRLHGGVVEKLPAPSP